MRSSILVLLSSVCAAAPAMAREPDVMLPLAGLALDLRAGGGTTYRVESSWSLRDTSYEGRDAIIETTAGNSTTTWLTLGWVGDCAEALARLPIDAAWTRTDASLWGERWVVRGGIARVADERLAGRPVIALCRTRGEHKAAVVTHHLAVSRLADPPDAQLAALGRARVPARISAALRVPRTVATRAVNAPNVVNVGSEPAARSIRLGWAGLQVALPTDGSVWIVAADQDGVDVFERTAPALPELSISVARLEGASNCEQGFELMGGEPLRRAPAGLPSGWLQGRTVVHLDYRSIGLCHVYATGVLLAGVGAGTATLDLGQAAALLVAIARAADEASPDFGVNPADEAGARRESGLTLPAGFLMVARRGH